MSGFTYPGQISYDSIYGSTIGSLTITPPANSNTSGEVPFIMMDSFTSGGITTIYSPTSIDIDASTIYLGNSATRINVQNISWSVDSGTTSNPTYRVVGSNGAGDLKTWFGVITSGAYGTSSPPSNIGSNGDFLFST